MHLNVEEVKNCFNPMCSLEMVLEYASGTPLTTKIAFLPLVPLCERGKRLKPPLNIGLGIWRWLAAK